MNTIAIYRLMREDGLSLYNEVRQLSRSQQVARGLSQYNPKLHDVASKAKRPDKRIFVPSGQRDPITGADILIEDTAPVSRVPVAFQNYIINQKSAFAAGGGVTLKPSKEGTAVFDFMSSNWYDNKTDFQLQDIFRQVMACSQAAVIFYGEKGAESFEDFRYKFKIVSPEKGDTLEPIFDEDTDNLIAFGREYQLSKENVTRYDLYIINESGRVEIRRYENGSPLLNLTDHEGQPTYILSTPYTKLPVVYWSQDTPECDITSEMIQEFETALSDFSTQMGYSGEAILFGKGSVLNLPAKGQAGKFIEGSSDSDLKYVQAESQHESRGFQFRMLRDFIFGLNHAVYLDIETMKSLGDVSGRALKYYLLNVYMEASGKQKGYLGIGVQRMANWMLHEWRSLAGGDKSLRVYVEFSQYEVDDQEGKVELAMRANGGLPVVTHKNSIAMAGLEEDATLALEEINEQSMSGNVTNEEVIDEV